MDIQSNIANNILRFQRADKAAHQGLCRGEVPERSAPLFVDDLSKADVNQDKKLSFMEYAFYDSSKQKNPQESVILYSLLSRDYQQNIENDKHKLEYPVNYQSPK